MPKGRARYTQGFLTDGVDVIPHSLHRAPGIPLCQGGHHLFMDGI